MLHLTKEKILLKIYMQYFVAANQSQLFILNAKEGEGSCKLSCSALASWKLRASKQGAGGELSPPRSLCRVALTLQVL